MGWLRNIVDAIARPQAPAGTDDRKLAELARLDGLGIGIAQTAVGAGLAGIGVAVAVQSTSPTFRVFIGLAGAIATFGGIWAAVAVMPADTGTSLDDQIKERRKAACVGVISLVLALGIGVLVLAIQGVSAG